MWGYMGKCVTLLVAALATALVMCACECVCVKWVFYCRLGYVTHDRDYTHLSLPSPNLGELPPSIQSVD